MDGNTAKCMKWQAGAEQAKECSQHAYVTICRVQQPSSVCLRGQKRKQCAFVAVWCQAGGLRGQLIVLMLGSVPFLQQKTFQNSQATSA